MSEGPIKQFIDFSVGTGGDTGVNDADSILPFSDGENVQQTVMRRPPENLRQRSEELRASMSDVLYLGDADRKWIVAGPGKVLWNGSTTDLQPGQVAIDDNLYILPLLTPGAAQTPPVPPVASVHGTLKLTANVGNPGLVVTSQRRSYYGGDMISVQVVAGVALAVSATKIGDFVRTIKIVAPAGTTQLSTVITALNALTADSPATAIVNAALDGGALGTDILDVPQAKQFVSGNYDGEGHTITPAALAAFFGFPANALAEGDTLCVEYDSLVEAAATGGRRQSIPENSNTAIPSASFFNSRVEPHKLVNAIPICKVVNGHLYFGTGVLVNSTNGVFGPGVPLGIDFSATGTPDGATFIGAHQAGALASAGATVRAQLDYIAANWFKLDANNVATGANTFSGINLFTNEQEFHGTFFAQTGVQTIIDRLGLVAHVGDHVRDDFYQDPTSAPNGWNIGGTGTATWNNQKHTLTLTNDKVAEIFVGGTWAKKPVLRIRAAFTKGTTPLQAIGVADSLVQAATFQQDSATYGNNNIHFQITDAASVSHAVDTGFLPSDGVMYFFYIAWNTAQKANWQIQTVDIRQSLVASGVLDAGANVHTSGGILGIWLNSSGTADSKIEVDDVEMVTTTRN